MECELEALGVKPANCASLNVALHLFSNDDLRYMESMYVELDCKPELGCTLFLSDDTSQRSTRERKWVLTVSQAAFEIGLTGLNFESSDFGQRVVTSLSSRIES